MNIQVFKSSGTPSFKNVKSIDLYFAAPGGKYSSEELKEKDISSAFSDVVLSSSKVRLATASWQPLTAVFWDSFETKTYIANGLNAAFPDEKGLTKLNIELNYSINQTLNAKNKNSILAIKIKIPGKPEEKLLNTTKMIFTGN